MNFFPSSLQPEIRETYNIYLLNRILCGNCMPCITHQETLLHAFSGSCPHPRLRSWLPFSNSVSLSTLGCGKKMLEVSLGRCCTLLRPQQKYGQYTKSLRLWCPMQKKWWGFLAKELIKKWSPYSYTGSRVSRSSFWILCKKARPSFYHLQESNLLGINPIILKYKAFRLDLYANRFHD